MIQSGVVDWMMLMMMMKEVEYLTCFGGFCWKWKSCRPADVMPDMIEPRWNMSSWDHASGKNTVDRVRVTRHRL